MRVTVTEADGDPVEDGIVYALPARGAGSDDEDGIYHAYTDEGGTAMLAVPAGTPLDIGATNWGVSAMETDVRVDPGGVLGVSLQLGAGARVTVRCDFAASLPDVVRKQLFVMLQDIGTEQDPGRYYPGRGERCSAGTQHVQLDAGGLGVSSPLTPGSRYRVNLQQFAQRARQALGADAHVVPDPPVVEAGGSVTLRVGQLAELVVSLEVDPALQAEGWSVMAWLQPPGGGSSRQLFTTDSNRHGKPAAAPSMPQLPAGISEEQRQLVIKKLMARARARGPIEWPLVKKVPPGPWTVKWQGGNVQPGELGPLELTSGGRHEAVIRVAKFSGVAVAAGPGAQPASSSATIPIALAGRPLDPDYEAYVYVTRGDSEDESEIYEFYSEEASLDLDAELRRVASPAIAVAPGLLASPPFDVRTGSQLAVELKPGGLLLVVDGAAVMEQGGPVPELTRVDGAPIPYTYGVDELEFEGDRRSLSPEWTAYEAYPRVHARLGVVLGPFPAGTVEFRVRRGGFEAKPIAARVVAGAIMPLVLPR